MSSLSAVQDSEWGVAEVTFKRTNNVEAQPREECINKRTEMRFWDDSPEEISMKAALIATMGVHMYAMANIVCHIIRIASLVISDLVRAIFNFANGAVLDGFKFFYEAPLSFLVCFWDIVKAPFCAIAIFFCALFTIFYPLDGRVYVGDIERFWRGTTRKNHFFEHKANFEDRLADFYTNRDSPYAFFLAYCFQPLGSLKDSNVVNRKGVLLKLKG